MKTPSSHLRQTQALVSASSSSVQARSTDQDQGGSPSPITVILIGNKSAVSGSSVLLPSLVARLSNNQDPFVDDGTLPYSALQLALSIADTLDPARTRPPLQIVTANDLLITAIQSNEGANRATEWRDAAGNREDPHTLLSRLGEWLDMTWLHLDEYMALNHGSTTFERPPNATIDIGIDGFGGLFTVYMPRFNVYYVSTANVTDDEPETHERSLLLGCCTALELAEVIDPTYAPALSFLINHGATVEQMTARELGAASGADSDIIQPIYDGERQWPSVTWQHADNHINMKANLAAFSKHLRDALP